ncbi:hypothetical protein LJB91_02720, partial [Bacteroidales bacterium OttesenSCG-928-L03]|nr:hypothetical protein [Bacteroidales bacterium OttesenSCG-928-L03]
MKKNLLKLAVCFFIASLVSLSALAQRTLNGTNPFENESSLNKTYVMYNPESGLYYGAAKIHKYDTEGSAVSNANQQVRFAAVELNDTVFYQIKSVAGNVKNAANYFIDKNVNRGYVDAGPAETTRTYFLIEETTEGSNVFTIQNYQYGDGEYVAPQTKVSPATIWANTNTSGESYSANYVNWIFFPVDELDYYLAKEKFLKYLNEMEAFVETQDPDSEGYAALESAITTAETEFNAATTSDACTKGMTNLNKVIAAYLATGASPDNPANLSTLIINADFQLGTYGWTTTLGTFAGPNAVFDGAPNPNMVLDGNPVASTVGYQTISGLPEGIYRVKAIARGAIETNEANKMFLGLTAGDIFDATSRVSTQINRIGDQNGDLNFGWNQYETPNLVVGEEGIVTFGIYFEGDCNWSSADNFELYYYGIDLSIINGILTEKVIAAQACLAATNNPGWYNVAELEKAITDASTVEQNSTALNAAITQLETAINNYNLIIARYAPLAKKIAAAEISILTDYPGAADYQIAIDNAKAIWNNTSEQSETVISETVAALNTAFTAYYLSQPASADNPLDITALIVNPKGGNATGWSGDVPVSNNGVLEFFNKPFDFNQTLTNLPEGVYSLKIQAFERAGGNDSGAAYTAGTEIIQSELYALGTDRDSTSLNSLYKYPYETEMGGAVLNGY